jgi:hypothetical protein
MGDISVAIDTHQLRFFYMELMGNFHMVGLFHLFPGYMLMTAKAIVIHFFIGKKIAGKQLAGFGMTIHTGHTGRMNL